MAPLSETGAIRKGGVSDERLPRALCLHENPSVDNTLLSQVFSGYPTPYLKVLFDGWVNLTPDQKTAVLTIVDAFNHGR